MAFFDRKMLMVIVKPNPLETPPIVYDKSDDSCFSCLPENCPDDCGLHVPSDGPFYPPPSPPPIPHITSEKYHMPFYFILMLCVLGAGFLFICYLTVLKRRSRSNSSSQFDENREDFVMDENHGPVLDHPIWYIRTIGLSQDVIDSISVFRYKKDESLVEGTDCSVCLTEFEEDESLRLLPKCSHAFHIPCIDTWLRSHKNCPLCRAPIVSDMNDIPQLSNVIEVVTIRNIGDDSSPNEVMNQLENSGRRNDDQLENIELDEEGNDETRRGVENLDALSNEEGRRTMDLSMKIPRVLDGRKEGVRVFSDLAEHRVNVIHNELQPARRSVSMDSSAVQEIKVAMNEIDSGKIEECSSSKRGDRNSSLYKSTKSSSFGRLQKVPINIKRSFSSSGKCSLPTTSKTQDLRQTM